MKLKQIITVMEQIAPVELKESFDNVGLMVGDKESDINKVLIALDCTLEVIDEAKNIGADLILTHHPLLFRKPSTITTDTLLGKKIIELIKNDINLYSAHTNWDSVENGLNDTIVRLLGFKSGELIEPSKSKNYENSGIGRIININEELSLELLINKIKSSLNIENLRYVGELHNKIKKIAIINGSGQDFFEKARDLGADCVITGDTTYHYVSDYKEMGMCIIDIGHFESEWQTLITVSEGLKNKLKLDDVDFVISKVSKDPYKFL
ncbi:dinuclear metal center protein, YbgI/SA1388 family [Clostridium cavendishii DSM 21758]|uniref:GTP cyclohydrolase 1 type 2 homolog n=1 Tax=Clostridium cavendishii DSM 21758 TaxID=1121302 RepID=A0A1M6AK84_9CLOT|nr:Nif3-like dinuclear metal center hexameric protein [Clostridium cavendishii]SHI36924.1 dinuclear metal center protein, YbgI/SA1388 family [Clostridium cavendishii DSM 21758]